MEQAHCQALKDVLVKALAGSTWRLTLQLKGGTLQISMFFSMKNMKHMYYCKFIASGKLIMREAKS